MGTLQTELIEKGLKTAFGQEIDKKNIRSSKRAKERFSRREIEDLMGCNRAIYVKRGGTIRQR